MTEGERRRKKKEKEKREKKVERRGTRSLRHGKCRKRNLKHYKAILIYPEEVKRADLKFYSTVPYLITHDLHTLLKLGSKF